jgi:DME family drug/metabolite transporter
MLAAVLWGTVGVAVKVIYALADTNLLSIGFLRLAISVLALLAGMCWVIGLLLHS